MPASSGRTLSDATTAVEIPGVPVAPGTMVQMTVTTAEAGANVVTVPVLVNRGVYAGPRGLVVLSRSAGRAQTSNL